MWWGPGAVCDTMGVQGCPNLPVSPPSPVYYAPCPVQRHVISNSHNSSSQKALLSCSPAPQSPSYPHSWGCLVQGDVVEMGFRVPCSDPERRWGKSEEVLGGTGLILLLCLPSQDMIGNGSHLPSRKWGAFPMVRSPPDFSLDRLNWGCLLETFKTRCWT